MRALRLAVLSLCWTGPVAWADTRPLESTSTVSRLAVGDAEITVRIDPSLPQSPAMIVDWVKDTAQTLVAFYGRYPVPAVTITVARRTGEPVNSGVEYDGRRIDIRLDPSATPSGLAADWRLTHEMFHLGFPKVSRRYHYLEEGLSDYLEPLARARLGKLTERKVWRDLLEGIPQGVARPAASGLDGARDWAHVYWGGCYFWLVVDLDIREKSGNARSLDDAIRAIVSAGGTGGTRWRIERVIAVGDAATGTGSIQRIHDQYGPAWTEPNLHELWRKLGVRLEHGELSFDDSAPLAGIRRAMTNLSPEE